MSDTVEQRTRQIGKEIFALARRTHRGPAQWLDDRLMALGMADEHLKAQLFRFVDVLPALSDPQQIGRHLREYLAQSDGHHRLATAAKLLPTSGWSGSLLAHAASGGARRLARRFIAGSTLDETIRSILALRKEQMTFTIDLLGEAVLSSAEADQYQRAYLDLVNALTAAAPSWPPINRIDRDESGPLPRVNVSVKLSSLYSQFDPIDPPGTTAAVLDRLRPILRLARQRSAFVNFDMEQFAFKDVTLRIFEQVLDEPEFRDWPDVGIAIQAYLCSSEADLQRLLEWARRRGTGVWVRLVKGAYWDYETVIAAQQNWPVPVWTSKAMTDANYEKLTAFLIDNHELLRPAFASHNVRSIGHALSLAEERHLPPQRIEFQLLYGMADEIKHALVKLNQRVRVYTPFGQLLPGMAYLVRRLLENTSNESFLRAGFLEHVPLERLLMNPLQLLHRHSHSSGGNGRHQRPAEFVNEPLADFSQPSARDAMRSAIDAVAGRFGESCTLVIGGRHIESLGWRDAIDPAHSRRVIGRWSVATPEQARAAIDAAHAAFPAWRDAPVRRRGDLLFNAAEIMRRRRFELAAWEVYECGKQWREADADVAEAIDYCDYYAREMLRISKPRHRDLPGEENAQFYDARGVCVVIAPWNFPLAILCGMTTAALVAGNTVVMKPAKQSTIVGYRLMEVLEEAGAPAGVVNFISGLGGEVGPVLVNDPRTAIIAFTGSRSVGLGIARAAAEVRETQDHVKSIITEMGGKNAIIIDDDADLDEAIRGVVASAFGYAGQKCSACSRVIALDGIYDTFLSRLVEATRSLRVGPPEDPAAFVGPVIDDDARHRILDYIKTGQREAKLAYSADIGALAGEGSYVAPHIFADVPPTATIAQEEIFGPVLSILRAHDLDEALAIANGTKYALTGGLYSRSPDHIQRIRREFRVGNLYINRKITGALVDRQPFGGFKLSGGGTKAGGPDYLLHFLLPRTVTENTLRRGFVPAATSTADLAASVGE